MRNLLAFVLLLVFGTACQMKRGSGNIVTENRQVGSFEQLDVSSAIEVELKQGNATTVVVECDDNLIKYVETAVRGNTLVIRRKGNYNFGNVHQKVYITCPRLDKIDVSGASNVKLITVFTNPEKLMLKTSGASSISGEIDAPVVIAKASGASDVTLSGRTKMYKADADGSSNIKSSQLKSEVTEAEASGASFVAAHSSISIKANASGAATIDCHGGGKIDQHSSGAASINNKN
jgi:hypothetical protein